MADLFQARSAVLADADRICELVNAWAEAGLTIARRPDEIRDMIGEFVVVQNGDGIIACGALATHSPALAEIRSVAAAPESKGTGAGSEVVWFLLEEAVQYEIDRVVLLTKIPGFFARFGFREIAPTELPEDFVAEAIVARGRTFANRTVMMRDMNVPLPERARNQGARAANPTLPERRKAVLQS